MAGNGEERATAVGERDVLRLLDLNFVEMTREQTRHVEGGELHEEGGITVVYSPSGEMLHNPILVHGETTAEALLDAAERHCLSRKRRFSIFTRQHADEHLDAPLREAGYLQPFSTPGMALARTGWSAPPRAVPELEVRPVRSEAEARAYGDILAEAFSIYGHDRAAVRAFFLRRDSLCGAAVQGFLAWLGDEPVAGAALYPSHRIAGIGWVGTRPENFGKRYGEAVTVAAIEEGFRRGLEAASLQASPMGQVLYRRLGFATPTHYRVYVYLG